MPVGVTLASFASLGAGRVVRGVTLETASAAHEGPVPDDVGTFGTRATAAQLLRPAAQSQRSPAACPPDTRTPFPFLPASGTSTPRHAFSAVALGFLLGIIKIVTRH